MEMWKMISLVTFLSCLLCIGFCQYTHADQKEEDQFCPYFDVNRLSGPEYSLVNCSWFSGHTCCKRIEVTAMSHELQQFALEDASPGCANRLNYMACFMCAPDQQKWYKNSKVYICKEFCDETLAACRDAKYKGTRIGSAYDDGTKFCQAQRFEVVEGKQNCYNFDPSVFDVSSHLLPFLGLLISCLCVAAALVV